MVKKNIRNGKYRCFGSSHIQKPEFILKNYSKRWSIENGIKDLIYSYFFQKCHGTENPNLVNVHFFTVSVCRTLFRMIQEDLNEDVKNPDGSVKTLKTMRNQLFRQGSAQLSIRKDTIEISFCNSLTVKTTNLLRDWFQKINQTSLKIFGGYKLKFNLKPPTGSEMKNSGTNQIFDLQKISAN